MQPSEGDPSTRGCMTSLRKEPQQKQHGQLSALILAWTVSQCVQLWFDGEKCALLLCVWKSAFLKSGHTYLLFVSILSDVRPMFFSQFACLATGQSPAHTHVISTPGHQWNQSCHDWMLTWCSTHHVINRWKQPTAQTTCSLVNLLENHCHFYLNNSNHAVIFPSIPNVIQYCMGVSFNVWLCFMKTA